MIETINLLHMPPELALYVSLYSDVQNASFLKEQLLAGNSDFEYAFIDASMILSRRHVLAAAFRAMNDYINERLKSRNIHSEIVFALSPNNNIGEAFRRFGISDSTSNVLVIKAATSVSFTSVGVRQHLEGVIKGTPVAFDDDVIAGMTDLGRIRKVYKLAATSTPTSGKANKPSVNGNTQRLPDERELLEIQVLGIMALRGAT